MTTTKTCPRCGEPLTIITDGINLEGYIDAHHQWGHFEFFDMDWIMEHGSEGCDYTEPLPEDIRMRLLGAPTLEGFGGV